MVAIFNSHFLGSATSQNEAKSGRSGGKICNTGATERLIWMGSLLGHMNGRTMSRRVLASTG
jgi:hypothetical protein